MAEEDLKHVLLTGVLVIVVQQTVANMILIINISNSKTTSARFELTTLHARVTSIKSTKRE